MVCLSSRFLCLAALVAAAATPSYVLQADARAVELAARHHDAKSSPVSHSNSPSASKTKGKPAAHPVIPLPPSANGKSKEGVNLKKHRKSGKKNEKRATAASEDNTWDPLDPLIQIGKFEIGDGRNSSYSDKHHLLSNILAREADPDHHHHHHHHHHDRRDEEAQAAFSLKKRAVSRIYGKQVLVQRNLTMEASTSVNAFDISDPVLKIGKYEVGDGRRGSVSETHQSPTDGVSNEKRSPHQHHHHDSHDKVIVNGDSDHVHVNRRSPHHHSWHHHDKVIVNGDHDDVHVHERRAPHHHHDHHGHDKVVVNGDNDDVHVHERRNPHHHHHHNHDEHDKVVVNGDNDKVHVHERDTDPSDDFSTGVQSGAECGASSSSKQKKRSDAVDAAPGVPGTVDIVNVGGPVREKLASLILSSFPDNSTTNSSSLLNSTKSTADPDASPFILDASNTTKTQFFLVVKEAPIGSILPSASLADTIAALKAVASTKSAKDDPQTADIKVTLQVPVFEPSQAAMRPYCATYDPNPPTPAPLTMAKCFSEIDTSDKIPIHKSQTFAYNPITGIVRPMWFGVTPPADANLTDSSSNVTDANPSTNSSTGLSDKQKNFKIPTSMKNGPITMPGPAANATHAVNGTAPSLPVGVPTPPAISPQNVTLVFTPVGPAVHEVGSPFDAASFEPAGSGAFADSDSGSDDDDTEDVDSVSSEMSMSSGSSTAISTDSTMGTTVTDSSNAATATDSSDSNSATLSGVKADVQPTTTSTGVTSNATDMMSASATSSGVGGESSGSVAPSPTMSVDEAAIEKMYQQGPHVF